MGSILKALAGFIDRIQPRDIIGAGCLAIIFYLISKGFDGWLQGVGALIIGYYFSKRIFEEKIKKN